MNVGGAVRRKDNEIGSIVIGRADDERRRIAGCDLVARRDTQRAQASDKR